MAYPEPLSNWVISRVELFPGDDLRRLEQIVECDVGLLNGVEGPQRHRYEFRFQNENQGVRPQFTVIRRHPEYGTTREEECISRTSSLRAALQDDTTFDIVPQWDVASTSCNTKIGEIPYDWPING